MPFVKVGPRHQITIPQEVRRAVGIEAGDMLEVIAQKGKVVIMPRQIVAKAPAPRLSAEEQDLLGAARQKIRAIQEDILASTGLTREEADLAAKAGLIDPEQRYWWTEEWQEGEREVERNYREGNFEVFDNANDFLKSLKSS
jgi:AbrB family looped-hinge helix DNA binding protein